MLIHFKVSNFRSIGEEQSLKMVASRAKKGLENHCVDLAQSDEQALRLAVIYGANGAGKSNLVRAIDFARDLVVFGSENLLSRLKFNQFILCHKPSTDSHFEFRFVARERMFTYGFETSNEQIKKEWLSTTSCSNRKVQIFSRTDNEIVFGDFKKFDLLDKQSEKLFDALTVLGAKSNQLMLNKIIDLENDSRGKLLNAAIDWFENSLTIITPDSQFSSIVNFLSEDNEFKRKAASFLSAAGTGIIDIDIESTSIETSKLPNQLVETLQQVSHSKLIQRTNLK